MVYRSTWTAEDDATIYNCRERNLSATQIAKLLGRKVPAVRSHIQRLIRYGLLARAPMGRKRRHAVKPIAPEPQYLRRCQCCQQLGSWDPCRHCGAPIGVA